MSRRRRVVGTQLELFAEPEHQAEHWSNKAPEFDGQRHTYRGTTWVGHNGGWLLEETYRRLTAARAELDQQ